jgi:hypothetical protein
MENLLFVPQIRTYHGKIPLHTEEKYLHNSVVACCILTIGLLNRLPLGKLITVLGTLGNNLGIAFNHPILNSSEFRKLLSSVSVSPLQAFGILLTKKLQPTWV